MSVLLHLHLKRLLVTVHIKLNLIYEGEFVEGIVIEDSDSGYESEVVNNSSQSFQTSPNQKPINVPSKSKLKNIEFVKIKGSDEAKKHALHIKIKILLVVLHCLVP